MRIAICEDNEEHAEILRAMILRWAEKKGIKADICRYVSAEQYMVGMEKDTHYDLIFLDIEMKNMNGLHLAKYIRKTDKAVPIVFTTGYKDYALKGYDVTALRYLIKPLKEQEVAAALEKARYMVKENGKDAVIVPTAEAVVRVYRNDIYYVEADNHYIIVHTKTGDMRYKEKLGNVEGQYAEPHFCKCHRSYIVNLHHVGKLTKDKVEIDNGDTLPVSKARWAALNECYIKYYAVQ